MVYGRYNKLILMGIISWFINQQTSLGGPHPVANHQKKSRCGTIPISAWQAWIDSKNSPESRGLPSGYVKPTMWGPRPR